MQSLVESELTTSSFRHAFLTSFAIYCSRGPRCYPWAMESEKKKAETQTPESESAPGPTSFCLMMKSDQNSGFVANIGNQFSEFIHASMDEHKACFKETFQKVIDSWNDWSCTDMFDSFKSLFNFQMKD